MKVFTALTLFAALSGCAGCGGSSVPVERGGMPIPGSIDNPVVPKPDPNETMWVSLMLV